LDAAIWGAELAVGDGRGRIYLVEPTGPIEDDPDLTDKKFPGNPSIHIDQHIHSASSEKLSIGKVIPQNKLIQ